MTSRIFLLNLIMRNALISCGVFQLQACQHLKILVDLINRQIIFHQKKKKLKKNKTRDKKRSRKHLFKLNNFLACYCFCCCCCR